MGKLNQKLILDNDSCTIECIHDSILHVNYKTESLQIEDYKSVINTLKSQLKKSDGLYVLFTQPHFFSIDDDVWEYIKENAGEYNFIMASAVVINSLPQRLMARLYTNFSKKASLTETFSKKEKAIDWLRKEKNKKSSQIVNLNNNQ